jgi:hypothetical protein
MIASKTTLLRAFTAVSLLWFANWCHANGMDTVLVPLPGPTYYWVDQPPGDPMPRRWNLSGVTFQDGGTATGYFVWDAYAPNRAQLLDFSVYVSGGDTASFPASHYTFATARAYSVTESINLIRQSETVEIPITRLFFASTTTLNGSDRQLRLLVSPILPSSGGTLPLALTDADANDHLLECFNCDPWRTIVSGSIVSGVPEPHAYVLMGTGLLLVALWSRRSPT